ncbi:hypothetical protein F4679DRAFT_596413, partial [Xylaria curta]
QLLIWTGIFTTSLLQKCTRRQQSLVFLGSGSFCIILLLETFHGLLFEMPTRIHILRPAPADVFHWLQDFACPIYQAIEAETNECVPPSDPASVWPYMTIRNVLHGGLVMAHLSLLDPAVLMGRQVFEEALRIPLVAHRMNYIVMSLRDVYPKFVHDIDAGLASEEELSGKFDQVRNLAMNFILLNVETEDLLPQQTPSSVRDILLKHFDCIRFNIGNLKMCLDLWEEYVPCRHNFYQSARNSGSALRWAVKMANRGLANYAVPGPIDKYLDRANVFIEAEAQRARQIFAFDTRRDLVYLTDPRHPDLFVRL